MPCQCGYCAFPEDLLTSRQIRLPVRVRLCLPEFTVVALVLKFDASGAFVVRFASGDTMVGLEAATRVCFGKHGLRIDPRKNYNRLWTLNVKGVGSLPIVAFHDKVIMNDDRKVAPFVSPVCLQDTATAISDIRLAIESAPSLHRFIVGGHNFIKDSAPKAKRQKKQESLVESGDDDTPTCSWDINSPASDWTTEHLCAFICCNRKSAPLLIGIDDVVSTDGNPVLVARFRHPSTDEEVVVKMPSPLMIAVAQYTHLATAAIQACQI